LGVEWVVSEFRRDRGQRVAARDAKAMWPRSSKLWLVTGYESLVDGMRNDPKGRHVLVAAVRANAEVLVTFNVRDFPEPALKPYDITAVHRDEFLLDQLDLILA
jgi:hypothetical protein